MDNQYIAFFQDINTGNEYWEVATEAQVKQWTRSLGSFEQRFLSASLIVDTSPVYDAECDCSYPIYTLADRRSYGWPESRYDGQIVVNVR